MNCILCGGSELSLQRRIAAEELIQRWQSEFGIDISTSLDRQVELTLLECGACRLSFFTPFCPAPAALYRQLEVFDWYYLPYKWEYGRALRDLYGCSPAVEIGGGEGHFVALARDKLGLEIAGIDINQEAVQRAQMKGRAVDLISLEELVKERSGSYKAVCCFQVLEHIEAPRQFLQACCDLLAPGGKLILALPNGAGFQFGLDLLLDMPPHHLTIWQPETLRSLGIFFPLEPARISSEPLSLYHRDLWLRAKYPGLQPNSLIYRGMRKLLRLFLSAFPNQQILTGMGMYAVLVKKQGGSI